MTFDFGAFWATLAANALLLSPVEIAVVVLVVRIYREVGKLSAVYQMVPDLSASDRKFVRWVLPRMLENERGIQRRMLAPELRAHPPWETEA